MQFLQIRVFNSMFTAVGGNGDGTYVANGDQDCSLRVWNADTGQALCNRIRHHSDEVNCLSWSIDGEFLASGATSGNGCLRNWGSGQLFGEVHVIDGNTDVECVGWSADWSLLAAGVRDGTVHVWNTKT